MKKQHKAFLRLSAVVMLIAVMAFSFISCDKEKDTTGAGEITITVEVVNKAGETKEHEITTEKTNLADALVEAGLVEGTTDQYGLYITTVDGEVADYDADQAYWALSKDGEYLMTGASQTDIADGEHYEITYTVYAG